MNYNFTGSITQRQINLGSAHEVSSSQLAQQAREERAVRQEVRLRHAASTKIQSTVRGRRCAQEVRQSLRQRLVGGGEAASFAQATRLVSLATRRHAIVDRLERGGSSVKLSKAEAAMLCEDDKTLIDWAIRAVEGATGGIPNVLAPISEPSADSISYTISLSGVMSTILFHLRYQSSEAQASYQPYLAVLARLVPHVSPAKGTDEMTALRLPISSWCTWLVEKGLYQSLRAHLINLPTDSKANAKSSTKSTVELILEPLQHVSIQPADDSHLRARYIAKMTENILTIPDLPNRISRPGLTQLVMQVPLVEVAEYVYQTHGKDERQTGSVDLLANLLALGWKRVPHFNKGPQIKAYLFALTTLQDEIPAGVLQSPQSLNGRPDSRTTMDAMEDGGASSSSELMTRSKASLSPATLTRLMLLPAQDHISALLGASAKFPNSSREALCAFLASTMQSWDALTRDRVLACITYRHSTLGNAGAGSSSAGGVASHSIEGLIRELWRGWMRGSNLAKALSTKILQGRRALLAILTSEEFRSSWPCLSVLCQLYSRSLLTIGDDEFYPPDTSFGSTSSKTQSASRNPLSLDEIVGLSALLRNLAFSLYWNEGTGGILDDMSQASVVGMRKTDLLSLRDIVTRLLQQLHQRDSRRSFAPADHWLMNSQFDLNSFIQSVVMEEDELSQYDEEAEDATGMDLDQPTGVEEDGGDGVAPATGGATRPSVSSRIASRRGAGGLRGGGLSARSLAYLSPRLGVLNNIPFVIPFEVRVEIFHQFTALDYERLKRQRSSRIAIREVSIRRSSVAEDGFKQLNGLGENLKHRFAIKFIDQFGMEESGIDGGGLFKEFLTSLVKEAFDTDRGLWSATSDQQLYPNPHSYAKSEENLQWYRFLGRILGKALYHGILVDVNFASFFLAKWLGKGNSYLDDLSGLESLDKEVYRNLLWLKHYTGDIEKDLSLDFTVTDEEFGVKQTHELIPNGRNVAVTRENRLEYIYRVSHYRLNEQIRLQSEAFLSGLTDLIDLRWLRMLNREELRILISGSEGEINLDDLRSHTVLGGYHEKDEIIEMFWKCLESFSHQQRKAFLKFVTSCPSPPLLGFAQLNPNLGIRFGGDDTSRLPSSSTCVNLLKLPRYASYDQCREKLLYAIESGAGFDLS